MAKKGLLKQTMTLLQGPKDPFFPTLIYVPIGTIPSGLYQKLVWSSPSAIDSYSLSHILKTEFFYMGRLAVQR